jgi:hypothetical protein
MRPQLFRLTAETDENNDELMGILRLTDEVNRVINLCKDKYPHIITMPRFVNAKLRVSRSLHFMQLLCHKNAPNQSFMF